MTTINRALLKAFERRADENVAAEFEQHPSAVIRGWAKKLREPKRVATWEPGQGEVQPATEVAVPAPVEPAAALPAAAQLAPAPVAAVANVPATPSAPPTVIEKDADVPVVSLHRPDGATLRFDQAHAPAVVAADPITPVVRPEPVAAPSADSVAKAAAAEVVAPPSAQREQLAWSWPTIVERLLACPAAGELRELADRLYELAADCDLRCVAFSGPGRRAGRTSLIATLAWVLAEEKSTRVAIVDANFDNPGLAQALSLSPAAGLGAAFGEGVFDPAESITNLSEKIVIAPLVDRVPPETINRDGIGSLQSLLRSLRRECDVVLIDAGGWDQSAPPAVLECRAIDAFVCVARSRTAAAGQVAEQDLEQLGIEWLGQVETFVPAAHA